MIRTKEFYGRAQAEKCVAQQLWENDCRSVILDLFFIRKRLHYLGLVGVASFVDLFIRLVKLEAEQRKGEIYGHF